MHHAMLKRANAIFLRCPRNDSEFCMQSARSSQCNKAALLLIAVSRLINIYRFRKGLLQQPLLQYFPWNMITVCCALLCCGYVIRWWLFMELIYLPIYLLIFFPYIYQFPSPLIHWHWGNQGIVPMPMQQPWKINICIRYKGLGPT